jgi:hypothetical protein
VGVAISIGSAVGAGFSLIGRRPLSTIGWGFFLYFAILLLFGLGFLIVGLPVIGKLAQLGDNPDPSQMGQVVLQFLIMIWPALLFVVIGGWVVGAMVQGAVYRSILTPDDRGFASLRLGRQEFALMLLGLVLIPIVLLVYLVTLLVVGLVAFLASRLHGAAGPIIIVVFGLAYALGLMWFALKFSLAAPMTFAEGRVRFFGSWSLTKGQGWALFGLAWLMVLIVLGVSLGYSIVSGIIGAIFTGGAVTALLAAPGAAQDPSVIMSHLPMLLVAYIPTLLMGAAFQGLMQAITNGPWAEVYRQLKGSPDVAQTFT